MMWMRSYCLRIVLNAVVFAMLNFEFCYNEACFQIGNKVL